MLFLTPNQQRQSTEGINTIQQIDKKSFIKCDTTKQTCHFGCCDPVSCQQRCSRGAVDDDVSLTTDQLLSTSDRLALLTPRTPSAKSPAVCSRGSSFPPSAPSPRRSRGGGGGAGGCPRWKSCCGMHDPQSATGLHCSDSPPKLFHDQTCTQQQD